MHFISRSWTRMSWQNNFRSVLVPRGPLSSPDGTSWSWSTSFRPIFWPSMWFYPGLRCDDASSLVSRPRGCIFNWYKPTRIGHFVNSFKDIPSHNWAPRLELQIPLELLCCVLTRTSCSRFQVRKSDASIIGTIHLTIKSYLNAMHHLKTESNRVCWPSSKESF
jgi:hypothetical protein